jgi:hypothetical protein
VISWINPAGGAWDVAANWDLGRTPQPDDDVVIGSLNYNAVVDHGMGADTVQSISSQGDIATLAVTDSSSLSVTGALIVPTLKADAGGQITANNTGTLNINLLAQAGGQIHLPLVSSYQATIFTAIEATGPDSLIDLPALTSMIATTGDTPPGEVRLDLRANQGGVINLPALTSVRGHPPDYLIGYTLLLANTGGTFVFDPNGSVSYDAAGELWVDSAADVQAGDIQVGTNGLLTVNGSLEATSISTAGSVTISGALTAAGRYTMTRGDTTIQGGMVTVGDLFDIHGGIVYGYGSAVITGNVANAGFLSVGTLTVDGNYTQSASGVVSLGLRSATDFDQLVITGFATLGGTLSTHNANGYQPQPGDELQVVQFGAGTGTFAEIQTSTPLFGVLYVYEPRDGFQPGVTLLF